MIISREAERTTKRASLPTQAVVRKERHCGLRNWRSVLAELRKAAAAGVSLEAIVVGAAVCGRAGAGGDVDVDVDVDEAASWRNI